MIYTFSFFSCLFSIDFSIFFHRILTVIIPCLLLLRDDKGKNVKHLHWVHFLLLNIRRKRTVILINFTSFGLFFFCKKHKIAKKKSDNGCQIITCWKINWIRETWICARSKGNVMAELMYLLLFSHILVIKEK